MAKTFAVVNGTRVYNYKLKRSVLVDVDVEIDLDAIGRYYAGHTLANKSGKTKQLHGLVIVTRRNVREENP